MHFGCYELIPHKRPKEMLVRALNPLKLHSIILPYTEAAKQKGKFYANRDYLNINASIIKGVTMGFEE